MSPRKPSPHPVSALLSPWLSACVGLAALGSSTALATPSALQPRERYQVLAGDTLSGIAARLFGDAKYWPQLAQWNRGTIANPHQIKPGAWLVFMPGTGATLPRIDLAAAPALTLAPRDPIDDQINLSSARSRGRSQQWRELPKQPWEAQTFVLPPDVDSLGFDKNFKITFSRTKGLELPLLAATDRIPSLGRITGAKSGAQYLTLGDTVYIHAEESLQVGEIYALVGEPAALESSKSDRAGYAYTIQGRVKIIGVREGLTIGTIVSGSHLIPRGTDVVANPARVPDIAPIAGADAIEAVLQVDKNSSAYMTAQHKYVYINRGEEDGVKRGMVFRIYEHYDLSNNEEITSSNLIVDGDAQVVQTTGRFSLAVLIRSFMPIMEDSTAVLLTDVSDLGHAARSRGIVPGEKRKSDELDELDKLDTSSGLGEDERRELEQLERWKGNPPEGADAAATGGAGNLDPQLDSPSATPTPAPTDTTSGGEVPAPPGPDAAASNSTSGSPASDPAPAPTDTPAPPNPSDLSPAPSGAAGGSSEPTPPAPPPANGSQESQDLDNLLSQ